MSHPTIHTLAEQASRARRHYGEESAEFGALAAELVRALTGPRRVIDVEPDTLICFAGVGIQVRAGFNPDMESGQPYVTVNTEDLPPAHCYGEDDGMPAIAVHLNDAVLFDDEGHGNIAQVVGTPTVYVVRPGDMSEDVAVFAMERHAQRFRDTYDDGDCGEVESAIVCDHDLTLALVKERASADLEIDMRVRITGDIHAHDHHDIIAMEDEPATVIDMREGVNGYVCRVETENYGTADIPIRDDITIEPDTSVHARLEYLRGELRAERISWGELHELQGLAEHIEPGDVELLEAAGVPEHPEDPDYETLLADPELSDEARETLRAQARDAGEDI